MCLLWGVYFISNPLLLTPLFTSLQSSSIQQHKRLLRHNKLNGGLIHKTTAFYFPPEEQPSNTPTLKAPETETIQVYSKPFRPLKSHVNVLFQD